MPLMLAVLMGCGPDLTTNAAKDTDFEEPTDADPPAITTTPVAEAQPFGADVPITATVVDDASVVTRVSIFFKNETGSGSDWDNLGMTSTDGVTYTATIPGAVESSAGMFYYIEAYDSAQNFAWSPKNGPTDPYHFSVYEE